MQKFSVMIVDDNEADRYILDRFLKKTGVVSKVFEADDGKTALEFIGDYNGNKEKYSDEFPPMVIFLDINMPLVNGFEFLEQFNNIKNSVEFEPVVVMMFSSSERSEDKERAFAYGFVKDFIVKGNANTELLKEKIINSTQQS